MRPVPLSVAVVLAAALGVVTALVVAGVPTLLAFDDAAIVAANAAMVGHDGLITAAKAVTDAGSPVSVDVLTGVAVVALLLCRRSRAAVYVLVVRLVELGVETGLKWIIERPRPTVPVVLTTASASSFPSGHAAGTAALCVSLLALTLPHIGRAARFLLLLAAVVVAVAVAASRVVLGVHYPSDVLAGLLLGALCALAATPILSRVTHRGPDADDG
jgi:undecaprenyl-diphosphatase